MLKPFEHIAPYPPSILMPGARTSGGGRGREGSDGGVEWALGSFAVGLIGDTSSSSLETSLNTDIQALYGPGPVRYHPSVHFVLHKGDR